MTSKESRKRQNAKRSYSYSLASHTREEWRVLKEKYGQKCAACKQPSENLTRDHIVPVSAGGSSWIGNIQPLCFDCNCRKGSQVLDFRPKPKKQNSHPKEFDGTEIIDL